MEEKIAETLEPVPEGVVVYNRFIRNRNVLLSEVRMAALFEAWNVHCNTYRIETSDPVQSLFMDLLAAATLHGASRPRNELMAWTIRYPEPCVSFFLGLDTEVGSVTGRFFEQNIKEDPMGEMHQELHRSGKTPHLSMIEFSGSTAADAVNVFYDRSEQRPARFIKMGDDHYALASAHPDYDEGWFTHINREIIRNLAETETLNLLEERRYYWLCGCSKMKIMEMLLPAFQKDPSHIFGDDSTAQVNCPRCSATYEMTRDDLQQLIDNAQGGNDS